MALANAHPVIVATLRDTVNHTFSTDPLEQHNNGNVAKTSSPTTDTITHVAAPTLRDTVNYTSLTTDLLAPDNNANAYLTPESPTTVEDSDDDSDNDDPNEPASWVSTGKGMREKGKHKKHSNTSYFSHISHVHSTPSLPLYCTHPFNPLCPLLSYSIIDPHTRLTATPSFAQVLHEILFLQGLISKGLTLAQHSHDLKPYIRAAIFRLNLLLDSSGDHECVSERGCLIYSSDDPRWPAWLDSTFHVQQKVFKPLNDNHPLRQSLRQFLNNPSIFAILSENLPPLLADWHQQSEEQLEMNCNILASTTDVHRIYEDVHNYHTHFILYFSEYIDSVLALKFNVLDQENLAIDWPPNPTYDKPNERRNVVESLVKVDHYSQNSFIAFAHLLSTLK